MTEFIIDSHAWLEYMLGTTSGQSVREIAESGKNKIFTHVLSLAEISSRLSRSGEDPSSTIEIILSLSKIIGIGGEISVRAGNLHASVRKNVKDFGLVDAFILLSAKENGLKILTGDLHFRGMKEVTLI